MDKVAQWPSWTKPISSAWGWLDQGAHAARTLGRTGAHTTRRGIENAAGRAAVGAGLGGAAGALSESPENRQQGALRGAILGGVAGAALPAVLQTAHDVGRGSADFLRHPIARTREGWLSNSPVSSVGKLTGNRPEIALGQQYGELMNRARTSPLSAREIRRAGGESQARAAREAAVHAKMKHLVDPSSFNAKRFAELEAQLKPEALAQVSASTRWDLDLARQKVLDDFASRHGDLIKVRQAGQWRDASGRMTASSVADELSRRGWTGETGFKRYLPMGGKGMTAGFGLLAVPEVVDAVRGEGSAPGAAYTVGSSAFMNALPALRIMRAGRRLAPTGMLSQVAIPHAGGVMAESPFTWAGRSGDPSILDPGPATARSVAQRVR